jgi:hypothetical protein
VPRKSCIIFNKTPLSQLLMNKQSTKKHDMNNLALAQ